jgi:hypothetical protein
MPYVALVALVVSPRADLMTKMSARHFIVEEVAAIATAITAAVAAFATVIPGYGRKLLFLPLLPLFIWLGSLGWGFAHDWIRSRPDGLALRSDWFCIPAIVLVGIVPAIAMGVMLRRGAPLSPRGTMGIGGLAAASLGGFGLRLFHPEDESLMVLVWQFGTVCFLSALAGLMGRYVLYWQLPSMVRHRVATPKNR